MGETVVLTEYFTYSAGENANTTTGQIATYRTVGGSYDITYSYTYDANGNILTVSDGTGQGDGSVVPLLVSPTGQENRPLVPGTIPTIPQASAPADMSKTAPPISMSTTAVN